MKRNFSFLLFCILLLPISSCKKESLDVFKSSDADILAFELVEQTAEIIMQSDVSSILIQFTPDVTSAKDITFEFILSKGAIAEIDGNQLLSGVSTHDFESPFSIDVKAEDGVTVKLWKLVPSNNAIDEEWGLGGFQKQSVSNNRDYEWYIDQSTTGTYAGVNCGPTTTTMTALWSDQSFDLTPEDAREAYRPDGGWWYTGDIDNYLSDNNINHYFIALADNSAGTESILKDIIDNENIAILCLDMYYVRRSNSEVEHVDKFYNTSSPDWGHFILLKGYKEVDDQYFFETYDPYSFNKIYTDGSLKGKDRYYRASDLFTATSIWWNNSIIITPVGTKSYPANAVDPATIPQAWGK